MPKSDCANQHPWLFTGYLARTPSGGCHIPVYIGEYDAAETKKITKPTQSKLLGEGVDVITHKKGCCVGAGSVVEAGEYVVEDARGIVECP